MKLKSHRPEVVAFIAGVAWAAGASSPIMEEALEFALKTWPDFDQPIQAEIDAGKAKLGGMKD